MWIMFPLKTQTLQTPQNMGIHEHIVLLLDSHWSGSDVSINIYIYINSFVILLANNLHRSITINTLLEVTSNNQPVGNDYSISIYIYIFGKCRTKTYKHKKLHLYFIILILCNTSYYITNIIYVYM